MGLKRKVLRSNKTGREVLATDYLDDMLTVLSDMRETNEKLLDKLGELNEKIDPKS